MDKIKILLIDDNPTSLMENEGKGTFLPSFHYGYSETDIAKNAIISNFELGWLQSPRDVREFRAFSEEIIQKFGTTVLLNDGFIPEIVLFDYKLSEGLNKFIDYDLEEEYKSIIPTYKLSEIIGKSSHRFFDWNTLGDELESIKNEIAEDDPTINEEERTNLAKIAIKKASYAKVKPSEPAIFSKSADDMGCFSGGLITFQFKDHPCIGIPVTSKEGEMDVSEDALYFEWLLSKDFDDQFGKKYGKRPFWNEVIPQAILLLKNRIELLVKLGKIIPSYRQLVRLTAGDVGDGVLSFVSVYGERHLPLGGLFIDASEETKIDKIKVWANTLVQNLFHITYSDKTVEIKKAIEISEELWRIYTEKFGDRMELSNLAFWESVRALSVDEQSRLEKLKGDFCNEKDEIEVKSSIQESFKGIGNKEVNYTLRLAVLHLVTKAAIEMNKCKKTARETEIYRELDDYEHFNLLFPIVKVGSDLVLPIHKENGKDALMEQGRKWAVKKLGVSEKDWLNFKAWITPGEKTLLKSIYFSQDAYYPDWLKS